MGFLVSPGVEVNEIDLTNVIPAVSTSIGGYAGNFRWGPIEKIVQLGSEKDLANIFGKPDSATAKSFLTAASFLKYGQELRVVRSTNSALKNAYAGDANSPAQGAILIKNEDVVFDGLVDLDDLVYARYAGALGNELKVVILDSTDFASPVDPFADEFDGTPSNNEIHVLVLDKNGVISGTGVNNTILEKWSFLSTVAGTRAEDGSILYYKEKINRGSRWIYFGDGTPTAGTYELTGGVDATTVVSGDVITSLGLFNDAETIDVNLLFAVDEDGTVIDELLTIADNRKDVVVFLSPPTSETVGVTTPLDNVKTWADLIESSNYAVLDSTALYVYDKYNDVYRWIPACGHMAGLCAKTDDVAEPWFSPAGLNRGQLLGVTKLAWNPRQDQRDTLYKARVNPIVSFPGEGIVLFGDKTAQSKPSAFDRINVRRLFIVLEKAIATAAKYQLFELNDEFTRAMFRNMTEPFLRDVKGRRGVTDFLVVCDETNNTGEVIDTNRFVADIYIKPARSINFITLNFIATRTGVEFSEIVGQ